MKLNVNDFIKYLQEKPYATRLRILWGTSTVAAVVVIGIWVVSLKSDLKKIDAKNLTNISGAANTQVSQVSAPHYTAVDHIEFQNNNLLIYFSVKNDTSDILNFSPSTNISLNINGQTLNPTSVTDRQNQPFVQKVLSNDQNFGIATFAVGSAKTASITFDNLYFEQSPTTIFKETTDLDLNKLNTQPEIRN